MILHFVLLCAVGKLLMFYARKFPPATIFAKKIHFPIECNLCLGFWTYLALILLPIFRMSILDGMTNYSYIPVFDEVVTAAFVSFVMYLFASGWEENFSVKVIQ